MRFTLGFLLGLGMGMAVWECYRNARTARDAKARRPRKPATDAQWDASFAASEHVLARLADEALAEHIETYTPTWPRLATCAKCGGQLPLILQWEAEVRGGYAHKVCPPDAMPTKGSPCS